MLLTNKDFIFRLKVSSVLFILIVIFISYFKFSSTDEIVINEQGNINGILNKLRYKLQDNDFLIEQKKIIEHRIDYEKKEPERLKEFNITMNEVMNDINKDREEFEKEYPDMAPSKIEIYIEDLRNRADKLEELEEEKMLEKFRLEHISELELILYNLNLRIKEER